MPELPEVEITVRNLNRITDPPFRITKIKFNRANIRNKIPVSKIKKISDKTVIRIYRRAKFIIFEMKSGYLVSHLGMTGSWRQESKLESPLGQPQQQRAHDHIILELESGILLIYNDPRRFGEFDFWTAEQLEARFQKYGPEPLGQKIDWNLLTAHFRKLNTSIKVALMNQKSLAGVGNIYANEALFRAAIRPAKATRTVTKAQYGRLWRCVRDVLTEAIESGGSTIQDFRNGYGEQGDFQKKFQVYDRTDEKCLRCEGLICSSVMGGRSTFWCKNCQT